MADAPTTPASAPARIAGREVAGRQRQRAAIDGLADGGQELVAALRDPAADHDQRRVEEVHHAREHEPDPVTRGLEQPDGHRIAERGSPRDVLGGHAAVLVEGDPQPRAAVRQRPPPPRRAPRAAPPASASRQPTLPQRHTTDAVVDDLDVADVAGATLRAAVDPPVRDDAGADAGADLDDHDVVVADGDAGPPLAKGEEVHVVVDPDRRAVSIGEPLAHGVAVPARHDRRRDRAGPDRNSTGPGRRSRCPTGARAGRASRQQLLEQLVDSREAALRAGRDVARARRGGRGSARRGRSPPRRCWWRRDRRPGGGPRRRGTRSPWRAATGARPDLALDDEPQLEQLADPLRDDATRQAGARHEL